jgi:hypothetical protein
MKGKFMEASFKPVSHVFQFGTSVQTAQILSGEAVVSTVCQKCFFVDFFSCACACIASAEIKMINIVRIFFNQILCKILSIAHESTAHMLSSFRHSIFSDTAQRLWGDAQIRGDVLERHPLQKWVVVKKHFFIAIFSRFGLQFF